MLVDVILNRHMRKLSMYLSSTAQISAASSGDTQTPGSISLRPDWADADEGVELRQSGAVLC